MKPPDNSLPNRPELQDLCRTLTGLAAPPDQLALRLQFLADLLADAGPLPWAPVLIWRSLPDSTIQHRDICSELIVGRQPGPAGLALANDDLLSRKHFLIRHQDGDFFLEDLQSHNGTALNRENNPVRQQLLRDGDLILAGRHVFAFLAQRNLPEG